MPFTGIRVDTAIVLPRRGHLDRAGRGQHLTRLVMAIAHYQSATVLIAMIRKLGHVGGNLDLQRHGQHLPGSVADDLSNNDRLASLPLASSAS